MDDNSFVLKCSRIQLSTFTFECYSVLLHTNKNAACHIWLLKRSFIQILKKEGVGRVGVTGVIEMKWQRKTLQNQRKSSFYFFFFFCLSLHLIQWSKVVFCMCNDQKKKKLKVILDVKLRAGIPTLITSWGMHELVSLSLEMELWQRPPITAINVLKFCSWWSFCVDIQNISIYYLQVQVVQCAQPNSTFLLLSSTKVL